MDRHLLEESIEKQAEYVSNLGFDDLEIEEVEKAKLIILDSIAGMAIGNSQYCAKDAPLGSYRIIGGAKADKATAIFLNGASMVKNELDEGNQFAFGHPACHILPSLLAECQDKETSGKAAITALVAAYEVSCRWGASAKTKKEMHVHGTMQTAGAAVASCKLNGCSKEEVAKAIILANSLPQATTWQSAFHGDQLRNAYIGLSNNVGNQAFRMVRSGIESSISSLASVWEEVLDGDISMEGLTKDLGVKSYIRQNYFKVHPACRYTHNFVDHMQELMRDGLEISEVEKIQIETYHAASKLSGKSANNSFASKFSIPVTLAVCMIYGDIGIDNLTDQHVKEAKVKELAKKIEVKENLEFNKLLPEIRRNKMTIWKKDGEKLERDTTITKGDYLDPFSKEEILDKFRQLTKQIWNEKKQTQIINYVDHLEEKENIQDLFELLGNEI